MGATSAISRLSQAVGTSWPQIDKSIASTKAEREELQALLDEKSLVPADCAVVVFGSLARAEITSDSDLDWTLLVDGSADPQHVRVVQQIDKTFVDRGKKEPGATGLFGGMTISHEIVHAIGGEPDTNSNTTRRVLLLLESWALGDEDGVRERVVRHLLRRYVGEDRGYHRSRDWKVKVPRFLLNDIVRFWRTMAVDYAAKRRDRNYKGWALRNFKLRLSRKLIFASGLAMCLCCQLRPSEALKSSFEDEQTFNQALADFLIKFINRTPLEIIAAMCLDFEAEEYGAQILSSYERFLSILDDKGRRERLDNLDIDAAVKDDLFSEAREIGTEFQQGLTKLFFESDEELCAATQRYGVF